MAGHAAIIPELDRKGLREFGIVTGAIVAVLFGLFLPWLLEHSWPRWPWIFFGVFAAWGLILPMTLRPVYRVWMRFGIFMSRITTPLLMGLVFYLTITPVGALRRIFGSDPMRRKFTDEDTYRVPSKKALAENLKRPY